MRSVFAKPLQTKKVGSSVVTEMTEVKAQLLTAQTTVNVLFGLTSGSCRTPRESDSDNTAALAWTQTKLVQQTDI